ncbi:PREDICTED: uncharacterized protein LOC105562173 isoform X3 [Vollenhovia emeryi]|uniref:uncharacterized protein LOC105562173 isoform X3 n=1 Tax=Vollenhovia emeryi TaxID=411798 RepID=UPI0005F579DD|nr:PREDICTED: uncharacterized protein LOC105562173 isoform X3 [Vollenhovia emeryi]
MFMIFILFALLPQLLCTMVHDTMLCSEYFIYTIHPETLKIVGRLEIPSPPENDEMLYLKVALNTTAYSLKGLFRIELARPIKETIQAIQQASSENIVSNIELGHYVYPPDKEPLPQDFQPWHRNSSGYRIDNPYYNRNTKCGVTSYYTDSTNRLIPNGETSLPGQWPWVVAIYRLTRNIQFEINYQFQCGGSLLTNRHVLTGMLIEKIHYFHSPYPDSTECSMNVCI